MEEVQYWFVHDKGLEITDRMLIPATLNTLSQSNVNNVFDNEADAIIRQTYLKNLYNSFKRTPYVASYIIEKNLKKFLEIESEITKQLNDYPYFDGIDFCDVRAGGIQIRGFHKAITGYTYGSQITIKYDFSNWKECIEQFVGEWKRSDTKENINSYQSFLDAGDRWGWD
ncbi:hypothetical protein NSQ62_08435 [Solibacillus sp. FSL H8-0523]|uniref:hypothetical protein n=1 Tax=Solibacillus sp. FSL H8-0523 TaxID=2954511 RepID=UPI003101A3DF